MKQKDIAVIIVVAALSAVIAYFVAGQLFVTPENRQQEVEQVDLITTEFTLPDERYFNQNSINPTLDSQLGSDTNQNPFDGPGQ